jgi:hypothetical protein
MKCRSRMPIADDRDIAHRHRRTPGIAASISSTGGRALPFCASGYRYAGRAQAKEKDVVGAESEWPCDLDWPTCARKARRRSAGWSRARSEKLPALCQATSCAGSRLRVRCPSRAVFPSTFVACHAGTMPNRKPVASESPRVTARANQSKSTCMRAGSHGAVSSRGITLRPR